MRKAFFILAAAMTLLLSTASAIYDGVLAFLAKHVSLTAISTVSIRPTCLARKARTPS